MTRSEQRGTYPKGVARRAQILMAALDAYGESDDQEPSLKQIAESVGLTEAGVLHYFDSKDDMLVSVLEARDQLANEDFDLDTWEGIDDALKHTYDTPGQVRLFVEMSVAAANPTHPAHAFMVQRSATLIAQLQSLLGTEGEDGWLPRILVAAAEGLQIQWLRDPTIDVVADTERLRTALTKGRRKGTPRKPPGPLAATPSGRRGVKDAS
jgi:AcrR family transcriptional regulator